MNESFTPHHDQDDAPFADAALTKLAPIEPSPLLVARIAAIPKQHPRARVHELVLRRSSVVALAAAALFGLLAGGFVDLDTPSTEAASADVSALDLPYGFDFTNTGLEGIEP